MFLFIVVAFGLDYRHFGSRVLGWFPGFQGVGFILVGFAWVFWSFWSLFCGSRVGGFGPRVICFGLGSLLRVGVAFRVDFLMGNG